jgi:flagellar basal body rod protein FlgG
MDALISAAASGMRARIESLDMLANNIANTSAPGFKADRDSTASTSPPRLRIHLPVLLLPSSQ